MVLHSMALVMHASSPRVVKIQVLMRCILVISYVPQQMLERSIPLVNDWLHGEMTSMIRIT